MVVTEKQLIYLIITLRDSLAFGNSYTDTFSYDHDARKKIFDAIVSNQTTVLTASPDGPDEEEEVEEGVMT